MSFLCSACSVHFDDNFQRREHMREEWHVYNVKRKMATLPPISNETYQNVFAPQTEVEGIESDPESSPPPLPPAEINNNSNSDIDPSSSDLQQDNRLPTPHQCIFCLEFADSISQNIKHMAASHSFVLPDFQKLQTDVETLLSYLSLVVVGYCECLYCGARKRSAYAVRAHMRTKGHCMLDLSPGSEFLEFWESGEGSMKDSYQLLSKTEMRLASGAVATSREEAQYTGQRRTIRSSKDAETPKAIPTAPGRSEEPHDNTVASASDRDGQFQTQRPSRALAMRDQMGLTGLSDAQRHSLAVSQRKIDLSALRSRNRAQWTLEKLGNKVKQKHFVVGSPCRSGLFLDPIMR